MKGSPRVLLLLAGLAVLGLLIYFLSTPAPMAGDHGQFDTRPTGKKPPAADDRTRSGVTRKPLGDKAAIKPRPVDPATARTRAAEGEEAGAGGAGPKPATRRQEPGSARR